MQYEQPFPDNRLRKAYSEQRVPHVNRIRIRPHWTISEDAKDVEQQMPVLLKLLSGSNSDIKAATAIRVAVSHYIVRSDDDDQFLAQLRHAVGIKPAT